MLPSLCIVRSPLNLIKLDVLFIISRILERYNDLVTITTPDRLSGFENVGLSGKIKHFLSKNKYPPCVGDKEIKFLLDKDFEVNRSTV